MKELRIVFFNLHYYDSIKGSFSFKVLYYTTSENNLKKNNNLTLK